MSNLIRKLEVNAGAEMETIPHCLLCGSADHEFLFWGVDRLHQIPGKFGLVKCSRCGLVWLSPRPNSDQLLRYYPEDDYYSYQALPQAHSNSGLRARLRDEVRNSVLSGLGYETRRVTKLGGVLRPLFTAFLKGPATFGWGNRLPNFVPDGRALEVGSGAGHALAILKGLGWNVDGIELSAKACAVAREHYAIDLFCGPLSEAPFLPNTFDYVRMSHVIEHLPEPLEDLRRVAGFMKPGAKIYIEAPNVESFGSRLSGKYWLHWDPPRHLFGFSPDTIYQIVSRAGLKVEKVRTVRGDFWEWADIYAAEDSSGAKLSDRDERLRTSNKHMKERIRNIVANLLDRSAGDTLQCWATK